MRGAKGVVNTFLAAGKTAQTTQLSHAAHLVVASRQHFVRVSLMPHIPDQSVFWGVENIMQSHRELYRAQIGTKVTACLRNRLNQTLAQAVGQRGQVAS